jgi:hypothetical protein
MAGLQDLDDWRIDGLKKFDWSRIQSEDFLSFPLGTVCARFDVMNLKAEELKARTKQFALDVLAFVKTTGARVAPDRTQSSRRGSESFWRKRMKRKAGPAAPLP